MRLIDAILEKVHELPAVLCCELRVRRVIREDERLQQPRLRIGSKKRRLCQLPENLLGIHERLHMLDDITKGTATMEELDKIEELAAHMKVSCLCALGQTASNPVVSTLRYFREEYVEHIVDKRCAAKKCKDLLHYVIDPEKCKGCTLCSRNCPVGAISGKVKEPHHIDKNVCIKCGLCKQNCKFGAVYMD